MLYVTLITMNREACYQYLTSDDFLGSSVSLLEQTGDGVTELEGKELSALDFI